MNSFREQILNVSPPEETRIAEQFIKDNPASVVSVFLVRKYFVAALSPDYAKASQLLSILSKEQPGNGNLARLTQQLKWLKSAGIGSQLPVFTAYDTNGKLISSTSLASAPVAVITTWSTSVFDSMDLLRELKKRQRSSQGKLKLMSICIDAIRPTVKETWSATPSHGPTYATETCLLQDSPETRTDRNPRQHRAEEWQNRGAEPEEE